MAGALASVSAAAAVVVVDVLSFTTAVTVAATRGIEVMPCRDEVAARQLAAEQPGTAVAVKRWSVDSDHPWSLSPADLDRAPPVHRLALASPNGSAIAAALAATGQLTVACSLRNVTAVADWLVSHGFGAQPHAAALQPSALCLLPSTPGLGASTPGLPPSARGREASEPPLPAPIVVVAAGEQWLDGSLRPAFEDLIGAGMLLHRLSVHNPPVRLSHPAWLAARAAGGLSGTELADLVRGSVSGMELRRAGYEDDVEMAVQIDVDRVVPVLSPTGPDAQGDRGAPAGTTGHAGHAGATGPAGPAAHAGATGSAGLAGRPAAGAVFRDVSAEDDRHDDRGRSHP